MDWMRYRKIYFLISASLIVLGIYSLLSWGLRLGIDFQGGAIGEYKFKNSISTEDIIKKLDEASIKVSSVQTVGDSRYIFRMSPISTQEKEKLNNILKETDNEVEELRFEFVGPSIGPELIRKTAYAIAIATISILLWVAFQFKSLKFGTSAILAMLHDTFNLVGLFSFFGHFFGVEIDFLFVTALLTTLSFSVHDTIVVYDRIRESQSKFGGKLYDLANKAVSETMVRSLNNSFTVVFMLFALILMGGVTLRWFAIALFIGTFLGTYSSPFVAVPLLVTWEEVQSKIRK